MFISGDKGDYEKRLHAIPTGIPDVNTYILEANVYLTGISAQMSGKWEREVKMQKYRFSNSGEVLAGHISWA